MHGQSQSELVQSYGTHYYPAFSFPEQKHPEGGINPGVFNCVCPEGDVTCLAGPQQCDGGGTYTQPTPPGCNPVPCDEEPHLCQCTGDEYVDEVNCFCSELYNNINYCTPRLCESSGQNYPCLCSGNPNFDPQECICNGVGKGDDDSYYSQCIVIDCKDPDIMYPGRCGCTQYNHPQGCEPTHNCHDPKQGYPCNCFDINLNTPDCICNGYLYHPAFCLCSGPSDFGCLCNSLFENEDCVAICQDGQFPDFSASFDQDNCICDSKDQTCLDGPNPCTDDNYDPEYPYACKIISCSDKTKNSPCLCTGDKAIDTPDCICKEGISDIVEPGSCYCDPSLEPSRTPLGCKCKEKGDAQCVCSDREDDPYNCYTICEGNDLPYKDEQFPNPGCLCRLDDDECLSGTFICESDNYIHPYPDNCYPQPCSSSSQQTTCICTGDDSLDPGHCRDHLCNQGEFPGSDDCMCSHNDVTCQAGRKPCSGGTYESPLPLGCYPVLCKLNDQELPCICTGYQNRDRPDCVCIGWVESSGLCTPAICTSSSGECICGGEGGWNPSGCFCDGNLNQPETCRPAIPNVKDDGSCTGGTNINPYPPYCEIKVCESSAQNAPCICSDQPSNNRHDCMCSAATEASVEQGSCICGLGHHPTGCICSSSSDSGCICSSTLATNPSGCTSLDCTVDSSTTVAQDSCVCTKNNHPTGCKPAACTGTNDYEYCLCQGIASEPETCTLDVCKSSSQQYPCICTGTNVDTPTCICSQGDADTVTPQGSCVCGINHHPTGCTCSSSSDSGCICSSISANNPTGCICSTTLPSNPPSCTIQDCKANSDTTVTTDSCYCTNNNHPTGCKLQPCEGTNDYEYCLCSGVTSEPETCTPVACESSSQQYSCICTGTDADTPDCMCSAATGASVDQGSCTCSINHHPAGCICSFSSDSGCICSSTLATNPSGCTVIDCKANSGTTVTIGSCVCTSTNHPSGCECPTDSAKLAGIPTGQCDCLSSGDLRQECKMNILACASDTVPTEGCICTGTYHPDSCTCPTAVDDLNGIPKDQCSCLSGDNDKRDDCKAKKGGGLSAGAIAGIIVAIIVVVLGVVGIIIGYIAYKKYWSSPERSSSARSLGSQNRWGSSRSVRRQYKVHDSFEMSQTQSAGSLSTPDLEPSIRVGSG
ncbi:MAG: hypothetical protein EZS28_017424 [Streblomastix strix]|uniref:Uncharacterized protein n=1 Tax=Streblomastix strix TaxID=222440 RepID=A0A5J4VXM2_9EUKA|nr:MAG: hypothetical protein EZS28_017424 [Streblomastix strix]